MGNGVQQYLCSAAPIPVTKDLLKDEEGIIGVRALREAESPPGAGARGGLPLISMCHHMLSSLQISCVSLGASEGFSCSSLSFQTRGCSHQ